MLPFSLEKYAEFHKMSLVKHRDSFSNIHANKIDIHGEFESILKVHFVESSITSFSTTFPLQKLDGRVSD